MGELGSRGHEPVERLIAQLKTQRVSFATYFPPKEKQRPSPLGLPIAIVASTVVWLAIGYAVWTFFK
jgi:hypothetical protein